LIVQTIQKQPLVNVSNAFAAPQKTTSEVSRYDFPTVDVFHF